MKYKDKVSIIIPTYNRAKLIKKSVDSILNQTYDNIEVIVVDDCSTDNTKEVIKKIKDERVKYIKLKKNSGACVARNTGIKAATGKYISFNDSDDEYMSTKIEKQYNNLIKNKSDMDFCKIGIHIDDEIVMIPSLNQEINIFNKKYLTELVNDNYISTQAIFIKRSIASKILFNEELPRLQDYDFVLRCVPLVKLSYTSENLVELYRQEDSISNSDSKLQRAIFIMMNYDYNFDKNELIKLRSNLFDILLRINGMPTKEKCAELISNNLELNNMITELRNNNQRLIDKYNVVNKNYNDIINSKRWKLMNRIFKIFGK